MKNCLFDATLQESLKQCHCVPSHFIQNQTKMFDNACTGGKRSCLNRILDLYGSFTNVNDRGKTLKCRSGDMSFPARNLIMLFIKCYWAACNGNNLAVESSLTHYPADIGFHQTEDFCLIFIKLSKSCNNTKRPSLDEHYPMLCDLVEYFDKSISPEESKKCNELLDTHEDELLQRLRFIIENVQNINSNSNNLAYFQEWNSPICKEQCYKTLPLYKGPICD